MLQLVSVTLDELSLEHHDKCDYDSVSLYDGSSTNSSSLGSFCTHASSTITSSSPSLFVFFQTDDSVDAGRFSLSWTFVTRGWFVIILLADSLLQIDAVTKSLKRALILFIQTLALYKCLDKLPSAETALDLLLRHSGNISKLPS